jgi:hypothetical protein
MACGENFFIAEMEKFLIFANSNYFVDELFKKKEPMLEHRPTFYLRKTKNVHWNWKNI